MASTPLTDVLPPPLAARAAALNLRTAADLLLAPPFEVGEELDAAPAVVAAARRAAAAAVLPAALPTLLDLVTAPRPPPLASGLPALDAALGGGFRPGALTEIVGGAGAGKTQLALSLAAAALASRPDAGVVWVDAEGAFSASRLAEVADGGRGVDVGAALADRTAVLPSPAGAAAELIAKLDALAVTGGVGGRRLALVVVDSAPAALARGSSGADATAPPDPTTVADLARALKHVAEACGSVVVAVNQVTVGAGGRGAGVAALGAAWAHAVSVRVALEGDETTHTRWARLVKAPAAGDAAAPFEIGAAGVVPALPSTGDPPPRPPWVEHEGGVLDAPLWAGEGGGLGEDVS